MEPDPAADAAQLSSIASAIEDLTKRITGVADTYSTGEREGVAADLYEAERALVAAKRRLGSVVRNLRS